MGEILFADLDKIAASQIVKLWGDPGQRKEMIESGMSQQQIDDLRERFGLE